MYYQQGSYIPMVSECNTCADQATWMHRLVCVYVFALCLHMCYSNFDKHHIKNFHRAQCTEPITMAQRGRLIVFSPMKIFMRVWMGYND